MSGQSRAAKVWLVICIVVAVILIGALAVPHFFEEKTLEALDAGGEVSQVLLVQTDGLQGVIVSEDVEERIGDEDLEAEKLSVFDLNDGRRVTALTAGRDTQCRMVAGDLLWCFDRELGLHGRDPVNLKPVWDQSVLAGAEPRLRGKVRKRPEDFAYDEAGGRVLLKTDQGYYYYLDAKKRSLFEAPDDAEPASGSYYPTRSWVDLPSGERLSLTGNERKHIQMGDTRSEASFLKAEFVIDRLTSRALVLPGPEPGLVLAHWRRLSDGDSGRGLLLSRVSPAGQPRWQVDVEPLFAPPEDPDASRRIEAATLTPQGLLLAYSLGKRGKLLMLDPATGAVRWKREL